MKDDQTPWIFEKSNYWVHDPEESYQHAKDMGWQIEKNEVSMHALNQNATYNVWNWEHHYSAGNHAFADENTRWERLKKIWLINSSNQNTCLATIECARYNPKRAWGIAKEHSKFLTENDILNHIVHNGSWCLHPGAYALIATSSKPELIRNTLHDTLQIDLRSTTPKHDHVHILSTVQQIFEHYGVKEIFDQALQEKTDEMLRRPGWDLRWLLYGDRIFEDFPNKKTILETLRQKEKQICAIDELGYRAMIHPPQRIVHAYETTPYIYEHPEFDQYLNEWKQLFINNPLKHDILAYLTAPTRLTPSSIALLNGCRHAHVEFKDVVCNAETLIKIARQHQASKNTNIPENDWIAFDKKEQFTNTDISYFVKYECALPATYYQEIVQKIMRDEKNWVDYLEHSKIHLDLHKLSLIRVDYPKPYTNELEKHFYEMRLQLQEQFPETHPYRYILMRGQGLDHLDEQKFEVWHNTWKIQQELRIPRDPFKVWRELNNPVIASLELDELKA